MDLPDYLSHLDITPAPDFVAGIDTFYDILSTANSRTNLTRITDREDFQTKHVADSLLGAVVLPNLQTEELSVADVGCGGGFPGIPLALAFPNLEVTEIDSTGKKIACVKKFIKALKLNGRAVQGRARELSRQPEHRHQYDVVTARAVSETPKLITECRHLLKPGGILLAYKTPEQLADERQLVTREVGKRGFTATASAIYQLPEDLGKRQFWILTFA